jgi:nucleotide-binding universal stress UspA family protein
LRNLSALLFHLNIRMEESVMSAKRILVPLKGTAGDEAVLSVVAPAASRVGATVRLLHVAPLPRNLVNSAGRVVMYADQDMGRLEAQWMSYLWGIAATLNDVAVECVVRFGDPSAEIVAEAEAWGAELVAMTARRPRLGWSWLGRLVKTVSRKARVPVLLYQGV